MEKEGFNKMLLLNVAALSTAGAVAAAAAVARRWVRGGKKKVRLPATAMGNARARGCRVRPFGPPREILALRRKLLSSYQHVVLKARQIGFQDINECPQLCKLANSYLRNTKNCIDDIYEFLANCPNAESLYVKFLEELDKCILGYFGFHWDHATYLISEEAAVRACDGDLKVTRVFSTLVEEMKAIGIAGAVVNGEEAHCTDVMTPVAHSDRSPVLLLMGGGMGAGKSTVLKEILQEPFWSKAEKNAVVVEADAFKETDVIYRAISSMGHHNDMLQTAELLEALFGIGKPLVGAQSSTDAASSLLVTALNEGRDVILDGTLSWEPFVEQTIAMARAVHRQRYRMGVGYKVKDDGTVTESYWEPDDSQPPSPSLKDRKPYRIEVVGVVCDAYLAVARGIRRAIITRRAVRVRSQLQSHKRFAAAFQRYSQLVDGARLYSTNTLGSAKLIAWKDGNSSLLVEPREFECLDKVSKLNENATSVHDLYPDGTTTCGSRSIWDDMIVSPARANIQRELRDAIKSMELSGAEPATPTL
ncbi:hypothetical protein PR202_gb11721 [Eleusine coracana subsp. coracana]|uniref:Zeta toxin domain-containing protein n=1 Tax=Eleusine coracana subsp. coracana TaxID=191504 RepID=A0AAV5EMF4_ELECO|nr:hypothetical protein PR202_gb11721 [Eleusine coracana subsp. coracana]